MKKIIVFTLFAAGVFSFTSANAQDYKTALGVRLSNAAPLVNNSISIKHFISEKVALEGLISFGDPFSVGALFEFHNPLSASGLSYFYGAGGYLSFVKTHNIYTQKNGTELNFGGQGIIGLDYKFPAIPLNISLDWKPELNIVSDVHFEPAAIGFSARFTFGK